MKKHTPKMEGQTSLDFLMTYGWALLLIVVVIGSLYALGIFNTGTLTGARSTGFAQIGVVGWNINAAGDFSLALQNLAGSDVTVVQLDAKYGNANVSFPISNLSIPNGATSGNFTVGTLTDLTSNQYYTIAIKLTYTDPSGFNYTESGTLTGVVGSS